LGTADVRGRGVGVRRAADALPSNSSPGGELAPGDDAVQGGVEGGFDGAADLADAGEGAERVVLAAEREPLADSGAVREKMVQVLLGDRPGGAGGEQAFHGRHVTDDGEEHLARGGV